MVGTVAKGAHALLKGSSSCPAQDNNSHVGILAQYVSSPGSSKEAKYLDFDGGPPKFYMLVIIFKK